MAIGDDRAGRTAVFKSTETKVYPEASAETGDTTGKLLQASIYESASPKTVSTDDGTSVMIWTADMEERASGNHTATVYSVIDSATDTWLDYSIVSDDGTADFYPDIATDGTDIFVTWVNAKTTFDDIVTITDCAAACEICVAKYDPNTKTFTDVNTLTDNNSFDTNPQIIVKNSVPYVSYMNNSENDPVTQSGTNEIFLAYMNEQGDYTSSELTTIYNPIASIDIGILSDQVVIAYSADMDGDITTTSDIEVYVATTVNSNQLTDNEQFEQNVGLYNINGQTALTYYCDGMIYCSNDLQQFLPLFDTAPATLTADYVFAEDNDGTILLVNCSREGDAGSNLYASFIGNSSLEWSEPIKLKSGDEYIKYFSTYKDNDGNLGIVFTKTVYELTDNDLWESTDLYLTVK